MSTPGVLGLSVSTQVLGSRERVVIPSLVTGTLDCWSPGTTSSGGGRQIPVTERMRY